MVTTHSPALARVPLTAGMLLIPMGSDMPYTPNMGMYTHVSVCYTLAMDMGYVSVIGVEAIMVG